MDAGQSYISWGKSIHTGERLGKTEKNFKLRQIKQR